MKIQKTKAFTLVELIIVITILTILSFIAFISLQWYSENARDSSRISDISSIKSSLELFQIDAWKYPVPTNWVDITYSGSIVWNQWTFGETVYKNVSKLDKIPLDPISNKEYTYSVTANKYEYQLGWIIEWDTISMNNNSFLKVQAWEISATAYVTWNYNWKMTKSFSGTLCNVLSLPTIITNDTSITDLTQIVSNNSFVYKWYKNLPSSFKTSKFKYDWWFSFTPNKLIAYSDTWSCTSLINSENNSSRITLLKWLQDSYSWSLLQNEWDIKNILSLDINEQNPSIEVINFSKIITNNVLWWWNIITSTNSWSSNISNTPTSIIIPADEHISDVVLLMHMDWAAWSTGYIDEKWHEFTNNGVSRLSNAQSKFGGSSLITNWTNGYISLTSNDFVLWNQPFTLEFWVYHDAIPTQWYQNWLISYWNGTEWAGWFAVGFTNWNSTSNLRHVIRNSYSWLDASPISVIPTKQWLHMAVQRDAVNWNIRISTNWQFSGYLPSTSNFWATNTIKIWHYTWAWTLNGNNYIDELRLTKWMARYSWNFTVPSDIFPWNETTITSWYFSWSGSITNWWKKTNWDKLQSCKEYNLQANTNNDWSNRWSWTCWNWTNQCLNSWYYVIDPLNNNIWYPVYCDMKTEWGWWMRIDTSSITSWNLLDSSWINNSYNWNWNLVTHSYSSPSTCWAAWWVNLWSLNQTMYNLYNPTESYVNYFLKANATLPNCWPFSALWNTLWDWNIYYPITTNLTSYCASSPNWFWNYYSSWLIWNAKYNVYNTWTLSTNSTVNATFNISKTVARVWTHCWAWNVTININSLFIR